MYLSAISCDDDPLEKKKVNELKDLDEIPISDRLHLCKNRRCRLISHSKLLNKKSMKCVNMSLFQEAVELGEVLTDKGSFAAMKDNYSLYLFSWQTFIKLNHNQSFDGEFYVSPSMLFLLAIRFITLNKNNRFKLLRTAIRQFNFHL